MEELRCRVCGKLASEDCHFYSSLKLCNMHYLQMKRHGKILSVDKTRQSIKSEDKICSVCGTTTAYDYRIWKRHDEYYNQVLCMKHYNQLYHEGEIRYSVTDANTVIINEDVSQIILRNKYGDETGRTIVDTEDLNKIEQHKWFLGTWGYAESIVNGQNVLLQRFILNEYNKFKIVDHINRDKLDNRKANLRIVTKAENALNTGIKQNNTSGIIGVSWSNTFNKWRAYFNLEGQRYELGYYTNKEEAIYQRLQAEKNFLGDFAPQKELFNQYGV